MSMKGDFKMDMEKIRNDGPKEEHEQPKEDQPSALMEKIQQLGQTNVPQLSQDSKIHCLTIIGQIEGHLAITTSK